jgi:hypothetical protein
MKKPLLSIVWSLLALLLGSAPASAQTRNTLIQFHPDHIYRITVGNSLSGDVLEIGGNGSLYNQNVPAYMFGYWGGANQQWKFRPVFDDYGNTTGYLIINRNSGQSLSVANAGVGYTDNNGARVGQSTSTTCTFNFNTGVGCWGTTNINNAEVWALYTSGSTNGLYPVVVTSLEVRLRSNGQFLTKGSDGSVYLDQKKGTEVQRWNIQDITDTQNPSGAFTSSSFQVINNNSGKALSVNPGDRNNRNVDQLTAQGLACEEWTFSPARTAGYYTIYNRTQRLVLDINDGSTDNGAGINIWESNQQPWQEWAFLDINDSHILQPSEFTDGRTFKIYSRHAGKVLEIGGGNTSNGARANMWNDFSHPWQQWHMQFSATNRMAAPAPEPIKSTLATPDAPSTLAVYPNPATNKLTLVGPTGFDAEHATTTLTTADGRQVLAPYQAGQLDVSGLSSGLYFLTVKADGQTYHQKFSKK